MTILLATLGMALAALCLRLAAGFFYPRGKPDLELRTTSGIAVVLLLFVMAPSLLLATVYWFFMAVLDMPWHMG